MVLWSRDNARVIILRDIKALILVAGCFDLGIGWGLWEIHSRLGVSGLLSTVHDLGWYSIYE